MTSSNTRRALHTRHATLVYTRCNKARSACFVGVAFFGSFLYCSVARHHFPVYLFFLCRPQCTATRDSKTLCLDNLASAENSRRGPTTTSAPLSLVRGKVHDLVCLFSLSLRSLLLSCLSHSLPASLKACPVFVRSTRSSLYVSPFFSSAPSPKYTHSGEHCVCFSSGDCSGRLPSTMRRLIFLLQVSRATRG